MNARCALSALGLLVVALGAGASVLSAAELTPLVVGWDRYFTLDWKAETVKARPVVTGHIRNEWGFGAASIRLLVEGLGAAGQVESQKVVWLGTGLAPGMRSYFEVPVEQAAAYRVRIFAFDWVQSGCGLLN